MKLSFCTRLIAMAGAATAVTAGAFAQGDECAGAANLPFDVATPFDTTLATPSAPDFSCAPFGGDFTSRDVWFEFTAPVDYDAQISTCGTADYDTKIEIYEGSCGALVSVGCFEDTAGCSGFTTVADFAATGGTQYFVRVGGWNLGEFGTGTILSVGPPPPPFECVDAADIVPDVLTDFDTTGATMSAPDFSCAVGGGDLTSPDVWFKFTAAADYMATATTCGTASYDTKIEVYSGTCGALVTEVCNDDTSGCAGFTSEATWMATTGTEYFVRIGGWRMGDFGPGQVFVTAPPPAVANDECSGAIGLASGVAESFDTTLATFSAGAPAMSCGGSSDPIDIWYSFTALDSGPASVSTCGTADFDTRIEVYSGDCGALVSEVCNDDSPGCAGFTSQADFTATAGTTYYARVAGFGTGTGTGDVVATYPDSLGNDDCSGAIAIGVGTTLFNNEGATDSGQSMSCGSQSTNASTSDVWYSYTASMDCPVSVDLSGSDYDTTMSIWSGDCMMLTEVDCDDDGGTGFDSFIGFDATAGTTYYIQIGGFGGASGDGIITLTEGLGTIVCVGNVNSTGVGADMKASGSTVAADNDLALNVTNLPANENVLFVNSRETIFVANPAGSAGDLCIGSLALGRHVNAIRNSGAGGSVDFQLNLANIPTNAGLEAAMSGETWYWQAWYRDMADPSGSNLSSAIGVTFD